MLKKIWTAFIFVLVNHTALAVSLMTAGVFITGHLTANAYFASWGIPYFKLSNNYTAFIFAIQNPARIITISISAFLTMLMFKLSYEVVFDKEATLSRKVQYALILIPMMFFSLNASFTNGRALLTSEREILSIADNDYQPFDITFSQRKEKCVHLIGEIGIYTAVYLLSTNDVELIKTEDISSITMITTSRPTKTFYDIFFDDSEYLKSRKSWLDKRNSICEKKYIISTH